MENIFHEKEEEGVMYGSFSYITDGMFTGSFEAKCSQACLNMLLQKMKFIEGLAVVMDDQALSQTIDALHIKNYFGVPNLTEMENLFLLNWSAGQLEVFGSLLAMYQVLKAEGLTLLPFTASLHPTISVATRNPECAKGYLYLLEDHWMVMRHLGNHWLKFDPWLTGAQLLNDFHVSLYIKQLLADGKLVFVVDGEFPACPADEAVFEQEQIRPEENINHPEDRGKPSVDMSEMELKESLRFLDLVFENDDNELALALLLSLEDDHRRRKEEEENQALAAAFIISGHTSTSQPIATAFVHESTSQQVSDLRGEEILLGSAQGCSSEPSHTLTYENDISVALTREDLACQQKIQRKNGTTVNPLTVVSDQGGLLNSSSDSDDLCGPFSLMFHEPGEGSRCLSPPPSGTSICQNPLTSVTSTSVISSFSNPASSSAQRTPKVFISTSDKSEFKKVLSSAGNDVSSQGEKEEEAMCCVCWALPSSHVVVPCGHFCLCAECAVSVQQPGTTGSCCPLCKQATSSIIRLYK